MLNGIEQYIDFMEGMNENKNDFMKFDCLIVMSLYRCFNQGKGCISYDVNKAANKRG
jgi:hypothetical protein